MLPKRHIKLITSLKQKKFRQEHQLFVAEGIKTVNELIRSDYECYHLYTTTLDFDVSDVKQTRITPNELKKISFLRTPNEVLGLFRIPQSKPIDFSKLVIALDDVRDPGNLGTIIRLCDWFGIEQLVCSTDTVDCYNSKVVQASMGSLTRVQIHYVDLTSYVKDSNLPVFIADMDGDNVYKTELPCFCSKIEIPPQVCKGV